MVVDFFPIAKLNGMVLHFPHIEKRRISRRNQSASLGRQISQAIVRHIILHAGPRDLVYAWTKCLTALAKIQAAIRQLQTQGQEHALNVRRKRLPQLQMKVNPRHRLVQLYKYVCPDGTWQTEAHPQLSKHTPPLHAGDFLQFSNIQPGMLPPNISAKDPPFLLLPAWKFRVLYGNRRHLIQGCEERRFSQPQ